MSEILITGGNGFVGRHLVSALQARGDSVRVLALPSEDTGWLAQRQVNVFQGDVRRPETLTAPLHGASAVLHLAAMMDVWRSLEDYRAVNVTGTRNVCQAALLAGVDRVVHMSSSSVYGMVPHRTVDESFPLAPFPDPYPVTKAAADVLVQRMVAATQLPAVIVRPDQIIGPGDHLHFGRIAARLRAGRAVIVGPGENALPLVYVSDLVHGLLLALDHPAAVGGIYNITSDQPITQRQLLEAIAHDVGAPAPRLRVPYRALYAASYLAEKIASAAPGAHRPPITRFGVAFHGTDSRFAIDKARRELGYRPQVTLRDGVRRTASWFVQAERRATTVGVHALSQIREGMPAR
jgi:nucleoside-diphosphate-sugar epimerase